MYQIIRIFEYSAGRQQTAWWKDVPIETNSGHISVGRRRGLQLSVTNRIRGGRQGCCGLQQIALIACRNTTSTDCCSQSTGRGRPFCNSPCQWVVASNICPVSTLKEFSNYSSKAFLLYFNTRSADIPDCSDFSLGTTLVPALTKAWWDGRWNSQ